MSTLAVVNPLTLVGKEIVAGLGDRRDTIRLITTDSEAIGTVTEVGGSAALVSGLEEDALDGVDLAFLCGNLDDAPWLAEGPPAGSAAIRLAGAGAIEPSGPALVDGVNLEQLAARMAAGDRPEMVISPHPGVVTLAQLLAPLVELAPLSAAATVVLPVSVHEQAGLDELFEQTRALLTFQPPPSGEVLSHQRAFNLLPGDGEAMARTLREVLPRAEHLAVASLRGGIFHGVAASVHVRFASDPGHAAVADALGERPGVELVDEPEILGPVAAASRSELLVGRVETDQDLEGGYWLWAVMDNLTRGGSANALAIADVLLGRTAID